MNKDWSSTILTIFISAALSAAISIFVVSQYDKDHGTRMVVMDVAASIAYLTNNNLIPEGGNNKVIQDMLNDAQRLRDMGYIVFDKNAVITTPDEYVYEYHGE